MIQANGLSKRYGEVMAVSDLSFSIPDGAVVGLLGPNGAGKTTSMRMLTTFLAPTAGDAVVACYNIRTQADDVRRNIGYLPENPPLYLEMRVCEYLRFVGRLKGVERPDVERVLEECSLTDVRSRVIGTLSKGYRQRVGIAQALIHRPKVLILDEPTTGLDPSQIIEVRRLIRSLAGKHTVVLSTHILQEVTETCSVVVMVACGRVVVQGEVATLTKEKTLEERFLEAVNT